jgi:hypothetical protein
MEKDNTKKREVTNIELSYRNREDIINLASKKEFVDFVLKDSLKAIDDAIENNLDKVELFNILNLSLIIKLEKSNFKSVLERIMQYYADKEDYDKCIKIQSLIKKI